MKSGTRDGRVALNHSLDSLFEGKSMILKHKPKKRKESDNSEEESGSEEPDELDEEGCLDIVRPVVVCRDTKEFIAKVMMERNMDPEKTDIKIGADDGQGVFKLNVQLLSSERESENPGRAKYSDVSRNISVVHYVFA